MSARTTDRETVVRWQDPATGLAQMPTMSGLDFIKKIAAGELPGAPMASHLNMTITEVEHGSVTFQGTPDESHYNPIGMVHGGYVCTLLDSALGCALHTTLPAGIGYTSIDIKTNFLRPVTVDSAPLSCTGRVVKAGRRVGFAEGEVIDAAGKVVATASSSLLIFPMESAG